MRWLSILAPRRARLISLLLLAAMSQAASAQGSGDDILLQMKQAFQRGDKARLSAVHLFDGASGRRLGAG